MRGESAVDSNGVHGIMEGRAQRVEFRQAQAVHSEHAPQTSMCVTLNASARTRLHVSGLDAGARGSESSRHHTVSLNACAQALSSHPARKTGLTLRKTCVLSSVNKMCTLHPSTAMLRSARKRQPVKTGSETYAALLQSCSMRLGFHVQVSVALRCCQCV